MNTNTLGKGSLDSGGFFKGTKIAFFGEPSAVVFRELLTLV